MKTKEIDEAYLAWAAQRILQELLAGDYISWLTLVEKDEEKILVILDHDLLRLLGEGVVTLKKASYGGTRTEIRAVLNVIKGSFKQHQALFETNPSLKS